MANDATNAGADLSTSTDTPPAHDATGEAVAESPNGSKISSTEPKMSEPKFKIGDVLTSVSDGRCHTGAVTNVDQMGSISRCYLAGIIGGEWHYGSELRHATAQEAFLAWNKGNPHVTFSKYEEIKKREQQEEQKKQQAGMPKEPTLAVDMLDKVVVRCEAPHHPWMAFWCWPVDGSQSFPRRRRDLLMVGDKFSWVGKETGTVREIDWSDNLVLFRDTDDYGYMRSMLGGISVTEQDGKLVPPSQDYQNWNKTVSGYPAWARDIKCDRLISVPKEFTIYMPDGTKKTIEASDPIASELSNVEPGPWEEVVVDEPCCESPPAVVGEQPPRKESSMLKTLAFVGKIGIYASAAFGVAAFGTISLYASGYAPEWLNDTLINTYLRYTEYQDRVFGSIGGLAAAGPLLYGARRLGVSAWQHVTAAFTTALADAVAKGIEDGTAPKK